MDSFARPVVVASACLEFEACRYNGQRIPFDLIGELREHVDFVSTCPEVEVGLGTPRDPVRLVRGKKGSGPALVQPSTGKDLTNPMERFAKGFLGDLVVDGFVLKSRSPSCGTSGVKIYDGADVGSVGGHGPGLFAEAVLAAFPEAAIEDEGRLRNYRIREHFLTKLFALARLREVERSGRISALVGFHSRYKLILMAYNQSAMRDMGRIVANPSKLQPSDVMAAYREQFGRALRKVPSRPAMVNVLEHAWGYVSKELGSGERTFYRRQLERYRNGRAPVSAVTSAIETSAHRFEIGYLLNQAFFHPFPEKLRSVADSGKGRALRV